MHTSDMRAYVAVRDNVRGGEARALGSFSKSTTGVKGSRGLPVRRNYRAALMSNGERADT